MSKNLIFIFIFIISANVAYSKSFNINCKINTGYEYNRGTDISGKYMPDSEGKSSGITENWNFIYSGQGPEILINNKKFLALPNNMVGMNGLKSKAFIFDCK